MKRVETVRGANNVRSAAMILFRGMAACVLFIAARAPCVSAAQTNPAAAQESHVSDAAAQAPKTLKERLGDKASDDQRVNNCKVPPGQRGSRVRPEGCPLQP
jgi:hypothetical protein